MGQCLAGSRQAHSKAQCRIASMMLTLPTLVAALVLPASAQIFRLPDADACEKRVIHAERFGKRYHFSWLEAGPNTKWDWEGARNYCRKFCMDSIAINSPAESKWVKNLIRSEELHYIWTGGRKCNFKGCDRKDLQPAILNGWYWAPTGKRIPPPKKVPLLRVVPVRWLEEAPA